MVDDLKFLCQIIAVMSYDGCIDQQKKRVEKIMEQFDLDISEDSYFDVMYEWYPKDFPKEDT